MANNTKNQGKNKKPSAGNPDKNSFKDNIQSALLFLGILVLCFSIFALMIKMDVGSFGSTVLAPMIGNVSGLNAILPEKHSTDAANTDSSATNDSKSVELTLDELATYDGKDGGPAYVAVNGTIYDVTFSSAWNEGAHQGLTAGKDLTKELGSSPHGDSVLSKLPVIGTLKN